MTDVVVVEGVVVVVVGLEVGGGGVVTVVLTGGTVDEVVGLGGVVLGLGLRPVVVVVDGLVVLVPDRLWVVIVGSPLIVEVVFPRSSARVDDGASGGIGWKLGVNSCVPAAVLTPANLRSESSLFNAMPPPATMAANKTRPMKAATAGESIRRRFSGGLTMGSTATLGA
jgi:hypothetical protein